MKRILTVIIIGILCFSMFGVLAPKSKAEQTADTATTVVVTANPDWTDTGLSVGIGDTVTITASGDWTVNFNAPNDWCGPGGNGHSTDNYCTAATGGELIAFVGSTPPQPGAGAPSDQSSLYAVGASDTFTSGQSGELWLGINDDAYTNTPGDNGGSVTASITVATQVIPPSPVILPSGILDWVPITLTNNQPSATASPFQQMIQVDSAYYSQYEASNLQNVEFFYSNGVVIPSWLESDNSNMATDTIYWLSLSSIPANSQVTIYMGFASTSTNLFNTQTTGEAPTLSSTYAQYDDGAAVFNSYFNFAGVSLPSGWNQQIVGSGGVTVNNGLSVFTGGATWSNAEVMSGINSYSGVVEGYVSSFSNGGNSQVMALVTSGSSSSYNYLPDSVGWQNGLQLEVENNNGGTPSVIATSSINPSAPFILGICGNSLYVNYNLGVTVSGNILGTGYLTIGANSGTTIPSITYNWIRMRTQPPNSVMPSASVSSVITPVPGQIVGFSDNFNTDSSLNTAIWSSDDSNLVSLAQASSSPSAQFVAPSLSFSSAGMSMSGPDNTYQTTGIQTLESFAVPLSVSANVKAVYGTEDTFELYLTNTNLNNYVSISGDYNSGYYGIWYSSTDTSAFWQLGTVFYSSPQQNTLYTISVSINANGDASISFALQTGTVLGSVSNIYVGAGSFYVTLAQRIGLPYGQVTTQEAIWQSATLTLTTPPPTQSSTSVVCSPNTVYVDSPVTCTATVSGSDPTGTITWSTSSSTGTFSSGQTPLTSGTSTTTYTDPSQGTVTITASYSGDTNNAPSSNSAKLTTVQHTFAGDELGTLVDSSTPYATGIASYGLNDYSNVYVPYTISTDEVMGYANIAGLTIPEIYRINQVKGVYFDPYVSLQLNVLLSATTSTGTQVYWLQNVLEFGEGELPAFSAMYFADNVWNNTASNSLYHWDKSISDYFDYSPSTSFDVYMFVDESVLANQGVQISFSYFTSLNQGNSRTFDTLILPLPNVQSASITVTGNAVPQYNNFFDAEFVWAGGSSISDQEATFPQGFSSRMSIFYGLNGGLKPFPSVYGFGCDTGETAANLQVSLANDGNALVTVGASPNNVWLTNNFDPVQECVTTTTTTTTTTVVDQTSTTDISVSVSSSTVQPGTLITVASANYGNTPPSSTGTVQAGDPNFYDVQVSSNASLGPDAMAVIDITNPDFTAQNSIMSYWNGNSWIPVPSQFISPDHLCGNFSVSNLTGTSIMVANSGSYAITFDQLGVGSNYGAAVLVVDNASYNPSMLPVSFIWPAGYMHTFAFQSPLTVSAKAEQYVWASTTGLSSLQSGSLNVTTSGSIIGNYVTKVHDVAVTSIVLDRTIIFRGYTAKINVTIWNNGNFSEPVNVTLYYNITASEIVGTQTVTLGVGESKTLSFVWDTLGIAYSPNCTLTAVATIPTGDFTPAENTLSLANIKITIVGDINGDGTVNILDVVMATSIYGTRRGSAKYNPICDIRNDGVIDILDIVSITKNYLVEVY
jgi:thermopsin